MAKWGRNPSGGSPAYLPAEQMPIGSPVWEMGDVDPNASAAGIPANVPMDIRRRGDFLTDPPAGGVEQPAAPAAPTGTAGQGLTSDIMAGLSDEDAAAVKSGLEGWMSGFNPDVQKNIVDALPDYGKNTPTITEWTPDQWKAAGYTRQPDGSWDIVTTPDAPAAPQPSAAADKPAPLTAAEIAALAAKDIQDVTLTGGGGPGNQGLQGWGGNNTGNQGGGNQGGTNQGTGWTTGQVYGFDPNIGPGGTEALGPMLGPVAPQFGVGEMAYRTDPFGVYSALRARGTPYDPSTTTMSGYRSALGRGFQPAYGRYTLADDVGGVGSFAEFLADPNRQRAESDVLRQRFMDVAGQLTGRSEIPLAQQGRYAKFFDPNISENVGNNLVNAALASIGGPSIFNDALRTSLANRYAMYQAQDPNQTGMGAARAFADYVAGQYSPTWGQQGQPMAYGTQPPLTEKQYDDSALSAYANTGMQNGGGGNMFTNGNGNPWEQM